MKEEKLNLKQALAKVMAYGTTVKTSDGTVLDGEQFVLKNEKYKGEDIHVDQEKCPCTPQATYDKLSKEDQDAFEHYVEDCANTVIKDLALTAISGEVSMVKLERSIAAMCSQVFVTAVAVSKITNLWFKEQHGSN